MKRRLMLVAAASPWIATAAAPAATPVEVLAQVRRRLADAPVLKGLFEQRKAVKGFRNPLVSRGEFIVARERGVVWATREPFASTLVVTRDRLLSRQADGQIDQRVDAAREPGIRAVNEMLFAVMAADLSVLSARFDVDGTLVGANGWRLVLRPREAMLARWIGRVELEGDRYVRTVRLTEASGDTSEIVLTAHTAATSLARDDAARFD